MHELTELENDIQKSDHNSDTKVKPCNSDAGFNAFSHVYNKFIRDSMQKG